MSGLKKNYHNNTKIEMLNRYDLNRKKSVIRIFIFRLRFLWISKRLIMILGSILMVEKPKFGINSGKNGITFIYNPRIKKYQQWIKMNLVHPTLIYQNSNLYFKSIKSAYILIDILAKLRSIKT